MTRTNSFDISTPQEHSRLSDLFLAACDLPAPDRVSFLDRACGRDTRLRQRLETLIGEDCSIQRASARTNPAEVKDVRQLRNSVHYPCSGPAFATTETPYLDEPGAVLDASLPTIAGYQILERIGQGGMGIVFRALQEGLKRTVALKILPMSVSSVHPELVERFRREASAAASLRHKNIVPVYDFGATDFGHYYSMEWIPGCSLDVLLAQLNRYCQSRDSSEPPTSVGVDVPIRQRRKIANNDSERRTERASSEDQHAAVQHGAILGENEQPFQTGYFRRVAQWMLGALDALGYAHRQGVLHRDIKPGNLMVAPDGRIVVADFGLAKLELDVSITTAHSVMGTLRYLSPEQLFGKRVPIDGRVDIYSLGATLYELLTLQPLFGHLSQEQLIAAIITQEPQPPRSIQPDVPRDLETICLKMLQKMPEARYASAEDVSYDLSSYLQGRSLRAKPPSIIAKSWRSARRHKVRVAVTLAILIAGSAVSAQVHRSRRARVEAKAAELVGQGLVAQQDRRWADADAAYRSAINLDPQNFRALGNLAIILKEQYNASSEKDPALLKEAISLCNRALDFNPDSAGLWNVLGVLYKKTGDLPAAAEAYRAAVEIEDQHPESKIAALNNLAEVLWLSGNWNSAESSLRASAELAGASQTPAWYTYADLAELELFYDDPAAADAIHLAFAHKAEPGWRLYLTRARIHLELTGSEDYEAALRDALAAEEQVEAHAQIERILGLAFLRNGKWSQAIAAAENAMTLGDMVSFPLLIAGIAEANLGDWEKAQERLKKGMEQWPAVLVEQGYYVTAEEGMLWFDKQSSLHALKTELEVLLNGQ